MMPGRSVTFRISRMTEGFMRSARRASTHCVCWRSFSFMTGLALSCGPLYRRAQYTTSTVGRISRGSVLPRAPIHERFRQTMLMKASSQSLTEQLSARFAQRIHDRLLAPGARLPSVRQCAQQQGVSASTVVAAYDQLLAQGLVEARKNRGFFVRETLRAVP